MWDDEIGRAEAEHVIEKNIKVNRARSIADGGNSPHLFFNGFEYLEQGLRRIRGFDEAGCIEESGLFLNAPGLGFVKGRKGKNPVPLFF